jgi:hypothetical protein
MKAGPAKESEMRTRRKSVKLVLAAALCGVTVIAALPANVLAGPMTAASLSSMITPAEKVYYRHHYRHRHYYGAYYPRRYYYRGYGYDPGAALFAGAALGLLGAGIAGATQPYYYGYGYPGYYYGYGYPGYYGWGW